MMSISEKDFLEDFKTYIGKLPSTKEYEYLKSLKAPLVYKIYNYRTDALQKSGFIPKKSAHMVKISEVWTSLVHKTGVCPCGKCNHGVMFDCNEENCECCSETCT